MKYLLFLLYLFQSLPLQAVVMDTNLNQHFNHMEGGAARGFTTEKSQAYRPAPGVLLAYGGRKRDRCRLLAKSYFFRQPQMVGMKGDPFASRSIMTVLYIHDKKIPSKYIDQIHYNVVREDRIYEENVVQGIVDFMDPKIREKWDRGWFERGYNVKVPPTNLFDSWHITLEIHLKSGLILQKQLRIFCFNRKTEITFDYNYRPTVAILPPYKQSEPFYNSSLKSSKHITLTNASSKNHGKGQEKYSGFIVSKIGSDGLPDIASAKEYFGKHQTQRDITYQTSLNPKSAGVWITLPQIMTKTYLTYFFPDTCGLLYYKEMKDISHNVDDYTFIQTEVEMENSPRFEKFIDYKIKKLYMKALYDAKKINGVKK